MTSFSIDEHSSMNNTLPNLNSSDTTPQIINSPQPPPPLPPPIAQNSSYPKIENNITAPTSTNNINIINNTTTTTTNTDGSEIETSDSNTHNSPLKDKEKDSKERDDLKEKLKAEKKAAKKLLKEMAICKIILEEMEVILSLFFSKKKETVVVFNVFLLQVHEDSWPFLLPVNTKQFPTYKKVIKHPMDLSTIKKRLQDMT